MSLGIISPMNFQLVKAAMATLLVNEMNAQVAAYEAAMTTPEVGDPERVYSDEYIENNVAFNVLLDCYNLPDVSYMPLVNIRNAEGKFGVGAGKNYLDGKWHSYFLSVECYAASAAEGTAEDNARADKLAAARLDYLMAQVFGAFEAEENFYKGIKDIVRKAGFVEWKQHKVSKDDSAETILAISAIYELQFNEPVVKVQGTEFQQLVASLEVDSQFVSPFVTVNITGG